MNIFYDKLSKKYARAFVNLFADKLDVALAQRIEGLSLYLHKHRSALFYVQLTALDDANTKQNFESLLAYFKVDIIIQSLIDLLLEHKRLFLLPRILHHVYELYLEKVNIMSFEIESAIYLHEPELVQLKTFLEHKTGKNILYRIKQNKDLIAGLKIYSNTLGFEHSIRKQLRSLSTMT